MKKSLEQIDTTTRSESLNQRSVSPPRSGGLSRNKRSKLLADVLKDDKDPQPPFWLTLRMPPPIILYSVIGGIFDDH